MIEVFLIAVILSLMMYIAGDMYQASRLASMKFDPERAGFTLHHRSPSGDSVYMYMEDKNALLIYNTYGSDRCTLRATDFIESVIYEGTVLPHSVMLEVLQWN